MEFKDIKKGMFFSIKLLQNFSSSIDYYKIQKKMPESVLTIFTAYGDDGEWINEENEISKKQWDSYYQNIVKVGNYLDLFDEIFTR